MTIKYTSTTLNWSLRNAFYGGVLASATLFSSLVQSAEEPVVQANSTDNSTVSVQADVLAKTEVSADALIAALGRASHELNYELSYVVIRQNSIEPVRLRHALSENGRTYAHLVHLSGPSKEVIQRGDQVSYFEPGFEPFTIGSQRMVAALPPLMLTNLDGLGTSYDFIPMGRAREAGVICNVVRVAPKDGQRYSYLLWLDENSSLVMRADLLDRDGESIEQLRVVSYVVNPRIIDLLEGLDEVELPPVVPMVSARPATALSWQVGWMPHGFEAVTGNKQRMIGSQRQVDSQLYSDGLFSFSVYVAKADNFTLREQLVRQGRRTLHSHASSGFEISVVGDIPPSTAKLIADSVFFMQQDKHP
ncbi:sigma-E factor regulatory protein RseB [Thaumasiovibrio sp. DFM-14]|uniref:sigma-E factor regulatory protein RseB n=1 Tax=Thaumasiovibrio sp. DFM-14 TaxID=3384792 RepID=UPI0039A1B3FE